MFNNTSYNFFWALINKCVNQHVKVANKLNYVDQYAGSATNCTACTVVHQNVQRKVVHSDINWTTNNGIKWVTFVTYVESVHQSAIEESMTIQLVTLDCANNVTIICLSNWTRVVNRGILTSAIRVTSWWLNCLRNIRRNARIVRRLDIVQNLVRTVMKNTVCNASLG